MVKSIFSIRVLVFGVWFLEIIMIVLDKLFLFFSLFLKNLQKKNKSRSKFISDCFLFHFSKEKKSWFFLAFKSDNLFFLKRNKAIIFVNCVPSPPPINDVILFKKKPNNIAHKQMSFTIINIISTKKKKLINKNLRNKIR